MIAEHPRNSPTVQRVECQPQPSLARPSERGAARRWSARWLLGALIAIGGCGGGGGATGTGNTGGSAGAVPTEATKTLVNDADQARRLADALVANDGSLADANESYKRINTGGLSLIAPATADGGPWLKTARIAATRLTKAVQTLPCGDVFGNGDGFQSGTDVIVACTGSVTFTAPDSFASGGGGIPAGTSFTITYDDLTVTASQSGLTSLSGTLTMTITNALTATGTGLTGTIRVSADSLAGSSGGLSYGPDSFTLTMTFTGGGVSLLIDGERISNLQTAYTDENDFTIVSGSALTRVDDGYLSVSFSQWRVVAGIPQVGSTITVTDAAGAQASIVTTAADANSATFAVTITTAGGSTAYTVFATFVNGRATFL
ncbi:MAG: hypothetical protein R3E87_14690 [Burkholderiaceae bacterium]